MSRARTTVKLGLDGSQQSFKVHVAGLWSVIIVDRIYQDRPGRGAFHHRHPLDMKSLVPNRRRRLHQNHSLNILISSFELFLQNKPIENDHPKFQASDSDTAFKWESLEPTRIWRTQISILFLAESSATAKTQIEFRQTRIIVTVLYGFVGVHLVGESHETVIVPVPPKRISALDPK